MHGTMLVSLEAFGFMLLKASSSGCIGYSDKLVTPMS